MNQNEINLLMVELIDLDRDIIYFDTVMAGLKLFSSAWDSYESLRSNRFDRRVIVRKLLEGAINR